MSALGHVWTAPWQELSDVLQHWSGAVTCPAFGAAGVAAGPNALRGAGPNRKPALGSAMTQTGSPGPRNDRICITSSCPCQLVLPIGCLMLPITAPAPCISRRDLKLGEPV